MCDQADEFYKVMDTRLVKARKQHKCCACDESIESGHQYWRTFALLDEVETYKHCIRCWTMLEAIKDRADGDAAIAWRLDCGELWSNNFGAIPEEVARLAFLTPNESQQQLLKNKP